MAAPSCPKTRTSGQTSSQQGIFECSLDGAAGSRKLQSAVMSAPIHPWTFLVVTVAGWIQREQQLAIEYLLEENRVLTARLHGKRLRFTDEERRRLAVKGNVLGRKLLAEVAGICLDRMIFFGERSLRGAVAEFISHYHRERNHQGLGNALIEADEHVGCVHGKVRCRKRLGGLLSYHHREAA